MRHERVNIDWHPVDKATSGSAPREAEEADRPVRISKRHDKRKGVVRALKRAEGSGSMHA